MHQLSAIDVVSKHQFSRGEPILKSGRLAIEEIGGIETDFWLRAFEECIKMREAIISLNDEDLETIGFKNLISECREAGIRDIELLEDDGVRSVPQIEIEEPLDEDRLESIECVQAVELVAEKRDTYLYILEIEALEMPDGMVEDHDNFVGVCDPTMTDQGLLLSLVGSQEAIRAVLRNFEHAGVVPKLEQLRKYGVGDGEENLLTERQYEVLSKAYDMGFYNVPKDASVNDVAEAVGLESATVSEHLQRAERNVLSKVFLESV